jgi:CRISPR-associated protein Csm3
MSQLKGHYIIKGTFQCIDGLRIGGSKTTLDVGGTDNPILRHPLTKVPYVPGSSLKGKMRSLLEQKLDKIVEDRGAGKPCDCGQSNCCICTIFGCAKSNNTKTVSRAIFRDCQLTSESLEALKKAREEGIFYSEAKSEVLIDRNKNTAARTGPRTQERIPEGCNLHFEIVLRVFEGDDYKEHVKTIKDGLTLIENDTLGGSGTRGYGHVKFDITDETEAF